MEAHPDQNLGLVHQSAGQGQLLFHTAGEFGGAAGLKILQTGEAQHFRYPGALTFRGYLLNIGKEVEIFDDGQIGVKTEILRHVADFLANGIWLPTGIIAQHMNCAAGGEHDGRKNAQGGGLAGAIRANQPKQDARWDGQIVTQAGGPR